MALAAGADMPALSYNLGLLYMAQGRSEEARTQLERASAHADYRLAAAYALGDCLRAQGRSPRRCAIHLGARADRPGQRPAGARERAGAHLQSLNASWLAGANAARAQELVG